MMQYAPQQEKTQYKSFYWYQIVQHVKRYGIHYSHFAIL